MIKIYHSLRQALAGVCVKKTLGVRILLMNKGQVLLVKHTYQPGWYTIGGGVDRGETPRQAMERELKEEVGATLTSSLELFSVYHHRHQQKRDDYVIFYVSHGCVQEEVSSPEIAEQQWFPLDQLPIDTTPATQRRIREYLGEIEVSETW